jgi:hypothetical protein
MIFFAFTFYIIYNKPTNIKDTSFIPSWPYTNLPVNDVLLNLYSPPLSDERYLVPINIGSVNTYTFQ